MTPEHISLATKLVYEVIKDQVYESLEKKHFTTLLFMAMIAYQSEEFVKKTLSSLGAKHVYFYDVGSVQAFFADLGAVSFVSFRGTEFSSWSDIKILLDFKRHVTGASANHSVHRGFMTSIDQVRDNLGKNLRERSDPDGKIIYVGHSLGGALATLFGLVVKPTEITTFGAPRLFNDPTIATLYEGVVMNRVVTKHDPVRFLPPNIMGYKHFGNHVMLPSKFYMMSPFRPHTLEEYLDLLLSEDNDIW